MERISSGEEWSDWAIECQGNYVPFFLPRGLLWAVDSPFSLVADTLLLPVDAFTPKGKESEEQARPQFEPLPQASKSAQDSSPK